MSKTQVVGEAVQVDGWGPQEDAMVYRQSELLQW